MSIDKEKNITSDTGNGHRQFHKDTNGIFTIKEHA